MKPSFLNLFMKKLTSEALMTATTSSPATSLRSSTASLVIDEVITTPLPMSILTWAVFCPLASLDYASAKLISRAELLHLFGLRNFQRALLPSLLAQNPDRGACGRVPGVMATRSQCFLEAT